ncbi:MAG: hypothetical protein WCO33_01145 [bacterium]
MSKIINVFSVVVIALFISIGFFPTSVNAAGSVTLTLSPENGTIGLTEQTINVNINTAGTAISVADVYISYDPAVLSVTASKGTISEFNTSGLYNGADFSTGLMRIQNGTYSSYTGSGLLAVLKVKTLSGVSAQDTVLKIDSKSIVTLGTDVSLTNQLTPATLGTSFTYSADPAYTSKDLPSTAIFSDNRLAIISEILLGFTLVFFGVRAIKIKTRKSEI